MAADHSRATLATVERACDVLAAFARCGRRDLGVTEIALQLDLAKPVVHRLLTTLAGKGLLTCDGETHRYRLAAGSLRLGMAYLANVDVRQLALPRMRELSARSGETVTVSLRSGWTRVYIDQVPAAREVRMSVELGSPVPLHAGGSSKALLAFLEAGDREKYLNAGPLNALTGITVTDPAALRRDLDAIRDRGYAVSFGERLAGAASIAAPVLNHRGQPEAVVSVCGPVDRFGPHAEEMAGPLLAETGELSRALGYEGAEPPAG
ncbi:IclR family transcriptional regulator [Nocardiopsis coralliicola]